MSKICFARFHTLTIVHWLLASLYVSASLTADEAAPVPVRTIRMDGGSTLVRTNEVLRVTLRGSDARYQCLVTGTVQGGLEIDLTRKAKFIMDPEGVASIDGMGQISPLKNGRAKLSGHADFVNPGRKPSFIKFTRRNRQHGLDGVQLVSHGPEAVDHEEHTN